MFHSFSKKVLFFPIALGVLGSGIVRAEEVTELEVPCLCKLGHTEGEYKAIIGVTDANRDAIRETIEAGRFELGQKITFLGKGCLKENWPLSKQVPVCGQTSSRKTAADGTKTTAMFDNSDFDGPITVTIFANGGIPKGDDAADGTPRVNEKRWPKAVTLSILGRSE